MLKTKKKHPKFLLLLFASLVTSILPATIPEQFLRHKILFKLSERFYHVDHITCVKESLIMKGYR